MVPRENKNKAYAKFGGTNKKYYSISRSGLLLYDFLNTDLRSRQRKMRCRAAIFCIGSNCISY